MRRSADPWVGDSLEFFVRLCGPDTIAVFAIRPAQTDSRGVRGVVPPGDGVAVDVYDSLTEAMGNTPLLRLKTVTKGIARTNNVLAKIEYLNPGGSEKDRIALRMVETAEREGKLLPGGVIV